MERGFDVCSPRGGRPSGRKCDGLSAFHFYPRPPRGGRRSLGVSTLYYAEISIHALREEGDRTAHGISNAAYRFLSTPSARRATGADEGIRQAQAISIHALREEGDRPHGRRDRGIENFYPRPPRGGRPRSLMQESSFCQFPSTPSARRATVEYRRGHCRDGISIHALREEGDRRSMTSPGIPLNFYPRPPRGGRPHRRLPVWLVLCHFYPRPPRGGRLRLLSSSWIWHAISIHALREEGDFFP